MAFCGECGSKMEKGVKFCPSCGKAAETTGAPQKEQGKGNNQGSLTISPHKSSLGLDANIAAAIVFAGMALLIWIPYVGYAAWILPLVFFFIEKESKFVKHAIITALVIGIIGAVILIIIGIIMRALGSVGTPSFSDILNPGYYASLQRRYNLLKFFNALSVIFKIAFVSFFVFLAAMAFMYKQINLPIIGPIAAKAAEKLENIKDKSSGN